MSELNAETLAEWRKDAERNVANCRYFDMTTDPARNIDARILALLDALDEQQRIRVEITRTLVNPDNCKVWRDGVLVFDGVSLDALAAEKAAREDAEVRLDHQRDKFCWHDPEGQYRAMEARAVKAEGTVEFLLSQKDEWTAAIAKAEQERDHYRDAANGQLTSNYELADKVIAAERELADLRARIEALADQAQTEAHLSGDTYGAVVDVDDLRALLAPTDPAKEGEQPARHVVASVGCPKCFAPAGLHKYGCENAHWTTTNEREGRSDG